MLHSRWFLRTWEAHLVAWAVRDATDHHRTDHARIHKLLLIEHQITFAYVFIYAWSVCIIKFSILALYRRIFGLSWLGYFCLALTTGYLITNHVVLPLYTRPLSYYWDQWYGADGKILVDEAKVDDPEMS